MKVALWKLNLYNLSGYIVDRSAGSNCMALLSALLIFIFVDGIRMIIFCLVELLIVYVILQKIPWRIIQIIVPFLILLISGYLSASTDQPFLVVALFMLIPPVTALLPMYIVPELTDRETAFGRVIVSYIIVSLFELCLILLLIASGIMTEGQFEVSWQYNALYFTGFVIIDIIVAFITFRKLLRVLPFHNAGEKPAE